MCAPRASARLPDQRVARVVTTSTWRAFPQAGSWTPPKPHWAAYTPSSSSRGSGSDTCPATSRVQLCRIGVPGMCIACDGSGEVEGDAATLAAAKAERERQQAITGSVATWTERNRRGGLYSPAYRGLMALGALEPEREAKARAAIHRGDPRVDAALEAYWLAQGPSDAEVRLARRWNEPR